MKLVCISDTHGEHERLDLPEGDVLIHAGDLTAHGSLPELEQFMQWFGAQHFQNKLCIAGNHDLCMESEPDQAFKYAENNGVTLLDDSGCRIGAVQFWGSPITPRFLDWAFMRDPGAAIEAHWDLIPADTDVLITHGPPFGILDQIKRPSGEVECTGCPSLLERIEDVLPSEHIFGHIHEARGAFHSQYVNYHNVSSMNEHYKITHEAVVIDFDD